ncbi:hypothetical protein [Solibacillus sp. CAU 1738]|uniref:hypothetical protein n=1 Tax=Solibacillus sp. CAU 1738 TaxID=3140363 RepID=UPI0032607D9E
MSSRRKTYRQGHSNVWLYLVILALLLGSTSFYYFNKQSEQSENVSNTDGETGENAEEEVPLLEESVAIASFKRYFMPDGTTAYFRGTGNEFASYKEKTTWLFDHYIQTVLNNGGAIVEKIYRITATEVQLVLQQEVPEEPTTAYTEQQLNALATIAVIWEAPFEERKKMGNRQIVGIPAEITTEYGHFTDVIIVEEVADNNINRFFYAPDYGLIRLEFYNNNDLIVTSELASIGKPYWENE